MSDDDDDDDRRVGEAHDLEHAIKLAKDALDGAIPNSATWTDQQWDAHDRKVAAERAAQAGVVEVRVHRDLDLAGLGWPARAVRTATDSPTNTRAIEKLLRHDFARKCIVIVSGTKGCGKTVAAARWAIDRRVRARFVRAATFAASSRYNEEQRADWMNAPALVLDDLGAEYLDAKGSFLVDLDELIDVYYGNERPLIITTNATEEEIKTRYKERIADRLRECGRFISVSDKSLRGPA